MLREINGTKFNVHAIRKRLNAIRQESRDSELRTVALVADMLIGALMAERRCSRQPQGGNDRG